MLAQDDQTVNTSINQERLAVDTPVVQSDTTAPDDQALADKLVSASVRRWAPGADSSHAEVEFGQQKMADGNISYNTGRESDGASCTPAR